MANSNDTIVSKGMQESQTRLDDSWLECSVCLEALTRNHKVLPCQHTFCVPCLQDLASSAKAKQKISDTSGTQDTSADNVGLQPQGFLCPECRCCVDIALDKLPSNVILNRILESLGGGGPDTKPRNPTENSNNTKAKSKKDQDLIQILMGDEVAPRKDFIINRALEVSNLDI